MWPGSAALARYLLDAPSIAHCKTVLDFGAGSGLAAIAAARCGAADVVALIRTVQERVADRYGVRLEPEVHLVGSFDVAPD